MPKDELVIIENNTPMCTSLRVAELFEKEHKNVLRDIEKMECSEEFRRLNFELSSYKNTQNKKQPMYLMTKDGFTILAMGFTGAKAMQFKELYIKKFNEMEAFVTSMLLAKCEFPEFTDNIKALHENPKEYHYTNEINMINRIVLGMTAKEYKIANNIPAEVNSIRPYLTTTQIDLIQKLQRADVGMLLVEPDYYKRQNCLKLYYKKITNESLLIGA